MKIKIFSISVLFFIAIINLSLMAQQPLSYIWAKKMGGSSAEVKAIANAPDGGIYITGIPSNSSLPFGNFNFNQSPSETNYLARLDSLGNVMWFKYFGFNNARYINDIEADSDGNCFILYSSNDTAYDGVCPPTETEAMTAFTKFDKNGNCIWTNTCFKGPIFYYDLAIDNLGNVFLAGEYDYYTNWINNHIPVMCDDTLDLSKGILIKYNSNGTLLWHKFLTTSNDVAPEKIYLDGLNNIYFTGRFWTNCTIDGITINATSAQSDNFLYKIDNNGNVIWGKLIKGHSDLIIDESGGILVMRKSQAIPIYVGNVVFDVQTMFVKLDSNGNILWHREVIGGEELMGKADTAGNYYVAGTFPYNIIIDGQAHFVVSDNLMVSSCFVLKISSAGEFKWIYVFGASWTTSCSELEMDSSGNIYVAGDFWGNFVLGPTTIGGPGPFLIKIQQPGPFNDMPNNSLITGLVHLETNTNCMPDTNEMRISSKIIKVTPGNYYGITDSQGYYQIAVPSDTSNINYLVQSVTSYSNQLPVVCPQNNAHNLTINTDTINNINFGMHSDTCINIGVQIASNFHRRCFKNNTTITYSNFGLPTSNAYIIVQYPSYVVPVSSSIPWVYINDSTYRFNLPYLDIAQQGTIYIIDSTKCINGLLGLAQCTKATIYPQTTCSNLTWSGADLNASGFCNNGIVHLSVFNEGVNNMTDSVAYVMYLDSINVTTGNIMINAGDTIHFQVAANGQSVHLHLNQVNNHPGELFVTFTQEACSNDSLLIPTSIVNSFPNAQQTGSKTHCLPIIGAYDPNDKSVVPTGFTANNIVPLNTRLEYLIRFQNTGTDTAFNVLLVDTLSTLLDPESIEMGTSSHFNTFTIQTVSNGKNVLKWQFNNINLPDSNTNLLGSNGFVQFRVSPKDSLPFGTIVRNKGLIYFDYNPAIITNNTITTFNNTLYTDSSLNELVVIVPSVPVLITPFDNAISVPTLTSYNWESVPYATWYQLEYDNSINFSTSQGDTCTLNQYLSPSPLDDLTTYYWRVKAFNGNNVSSAWSHVNIFTTDIYTGTTNLTNDQIKVFPNPAKNGIYIITNENSELQIEITDLSGRIVLNEQIKNQGQLYLPLNLNKGLYHLKVANEHNISITKLIIE